jgi:hypothetical protein
MVVLFMALPAAAQEAQFELEGRYWLSDFSAEARWTDNGQGTDINLKTDLGLENKGLPGGRFVLAFNPQNRLWFAYIPVTYRSDTRLRRTVEFGGEVYEVGTRVLTDLKMHYLRLGWAYQFIDMEGGRFKAGTLVELKGVRGEVALAAPELADPIDNAWSFYAVLPTFGVVLDVYPVPFLHLFAEVSGLPAGKYGTMWEAETGIQFIPVKNLSVNGGYRWVNIEARKDPDYAKIRVSGPFLGLSLRF